ncbi:LPS O-antigen length regulator [Pseudidiomarina marina]|uniref:Wzz/FepE/Etk N-terminal domain-containing protein n=1 Tax=Pseudidiomarina marina TaxID=502366 RepID=UPI00384EA1C9
MSNETTKGVSEIKFNELIADLWQKKITIIVSTIVGFIIMLVIGLSLPDYYRSEVTLVPSESSNKSMLPIGGELGSIATLAGLDVGQQGIDKTQLALEIIQSRRFINEFAANRQILPDLIAYDEWVKEGRRNLYDDELYDANSQQWVETQGGTQFQPSTARIYKEFTELLTIETDKNTGVIRIAVKHFSPDIAQKWTEWLIEDINSEMRKRDVQEARNSIRFLESELKNVTYSEMQRVFFQLMESQLKTIMLADVRPEYALQTIDPAVVPERPSEPNRIIISFLGLLLGGFVGVVIALNTGKRKAI